jgi:ribose transport system substrate-binding protein
MTLLEKALAARDNRARPGPGGKELSMAWLDRDRMPVRFTVVTSVASGLIVAAILHAFRTGISETATLMWFTLTTGGVAAASWVGVSRLSRISKRSRRAFLVTSAFSQKYYIAAFVQNLHGAFDSDGIDLVLKVPDRGYDASAQSHHLSRLLDRRHDYIGGVIYAGEVHRLRDDLTIFCRNRDYPSCSPISSHSTGRMNTRRMPYTSDTTPASSGN